MEKVKRRKCQCCRAALSPTQLHLCDACRGIGRRPRRRKDGLTTEEEVLLEVARAREEAGLPILEGMSIDEISLLARHFRCGYGTYGKFRAWVESQGTLPPERS